MKEVTILIPDDITEPRICYWRGHQYVRAEVVRTAHFSTRPISFSDSGMEELSKHMKEFAPDAVLPNTPTSPPSRKEFDALCIRVQRLELLTTSYQPSAEEGLRIVGCSDKEIEELRSRVEKLERESERQCARVIKMEEGISDDLK